MLYTNAVGDAGEFYFAYRVANELRWPCRLFEIDIGIDAQIEVLEEDRRSTGRFVAVQIKTTDVGVRKWQVSRDHIKYWRSISVPVFVALVDLQTKEVFLHRFSPTTNKVIIKFTSADIMNTTTAQLLRDAVSELETKVLRHLDEIAESAQGATPSLQYILDDWENPEISFVKDAIWESVPVLSKIDEARVLARYHPNVNAPAWEKIDLYLDRIEDLRKRIHAEWHRWSGSDDDKGTVRKFVGK